MPKAISKSTTHTRRAKADDALLDMIRQHRELYDEYDRIEDRDAPRTDELLAKGILLEFEITITPAHTARGLAGKRRVMRWPRLKTTRAFSIGCWRVTPSASPPADRVDRNRYERRPAVRRAFS
jgi:hypothetical protein